MSRADTPPTFLDFPLDQVLSSLFEGVVLVDKTGAVVYANPAYTRLLGMPGESVIGRKIEQLEPHAHTLTVLRTGQPMHQDSFRVERLGVDVVVCCSPIFRGREVTGAVTVLKDAADVIQLHEAYHRVKGLADYYRQELVKGQALLSTFDKVVGRSPRLLDCLSMAAKVAATTATVLVRGENGVGKDVLARAVHQASHRSSKPYIKVNCAAIPESLLESELFGYDPGAFTGAARGGKVGKFELADGGTLFLDEVGDMSPSMQAKLLRAVQDREIEKVGGNKVVKVNVRIIAATNQNLEQLITEGRFREDLYYRLNVFPLYLPTLRERKEDIPALADHFVAQFCRTYEKRLVVAPETVDVLQEHDWPGNVRELRNTLERAVIICSGPVLLPQHLGPFMADGRAIQHRAVTRPDQLPPPTYLRQRMAETERSAYEAALMAAGGNRTRAMQILGVSRRTFYKRLGEFGLT